MHVGINCIITFLLQLVGGNLVHESDTASFLLHVDKHSLPFFLYHLHRLVKLLATVTTTAAKDVACRTRGMHSDEDWLIFLPMSFYKGHMLKPVALLPEGYQSEVPILGRHVYFLTYFYYGLTFEPVGNKVLNGDDTHSPLLSILLQLRHTGHRTILIHYLHESACRIETGQAAKVNSSLSMSTATQHTIVLCVERINVSGTAKGLGSGREIGQRQNSCRTVVGRHTGGAAFQLINGYCEGCSEHRRVL